MSFAHAHLPRQMLQLMFCAKEKKVFFAIQLLCHLNSTAAAIALPPPSPRRRYLFSHSRQPSVTELTSLTEEDDNRRKGGGSGGNDDDDGANWQFHAKRLLGELRNDQIKLRIIEREEECKITDVLCKLSWEYHVKVTPILQVVVV